MLTDLPHELIEQVLLGCEGRQILLCKQVCKILHHVITNSVLLNYQIDLFVAGFDDTRLSPSYTTQARHQFLSAARDVWRGNRGVALVETLHVANLEYWPIRDSVLLRKRSNRADANAEDPSLRDSITFDVSQVRTEVDADSALAHWQIRLHKETGSIACIDATQDLLIVRFHRPTESVLTDAPHEQWYCLAIYSLSTGEPHHRASQTTIEFRMSQRVIKNPHYTRVHVLDNVLAVNMASGFQLFTETTFFDWTTGEKKAAFCSPGASARAWGHPAALISERCFLQSCYSSAERRPAIEVYVLDDEAPFTSNSDTRDAKHVATYWLPRVVNGDVRLILNVTSRQQVSPNEPDSGFLLSSACARMLHVQVTGVWFTSPFQCAFFTPVYQFMEEANRFMAMTAAQRRTSLPKTKPWATWGNGTTRWLEKDGPPWQDDAKSSLRGSGSRYVFPNYLLDFSPIDVAREVHRHRQTRSSKANVFASEAVGWTTHCHAASKDNISGADMFDEDIVSSLPYREKEIGELPGFELGSDIMLVNDKIVTIQGGVLDTIKIYKPGPIRPRPEAPDGVMDELTAAMLRVAIGGRRPVFTTTTMHADAL
ncbi:hypothetical protein BDW22DRAFT_1355835 [Trametopsis cervina]|nr:hypothetical protein BDW22DRAFT_1355835 [Trametopsis cervina]